MRLQLVIGNKNYSSWSMRPWVALREAGIAFEEILLKFDESTGDLRVIGVERYSPTAKVPVLLIDGAPVWDTFAIIETAAELFPERRVWPADAGMRRVARSICAEMHSSFRDLRGSMPMNINRRYPGKGLTPAVERDIARITAIWRDCRARAGGPFLFGATACAADAFFAPVVMRFACYAPPIPEDARAYCAAVEGLESVKAWVAGARAESDFLKLEEPYA